MPGSRSRFLTSKVAIAASAALFVVMPAFLIRAVHPALTAHWIILAVIAAALGTARARRWGLVALVSVHGVDSALSVDDRARDVLRAPDRRCPPRTRHAERDALISATSALAASVALLALVGAFSSGYEPAAGGFGAFQANALALIADNGMSHVFEFMLLPANQYEGIAFLGVGVFLLLAMAAILLLAQRRRWTGMVARISHTMAIRHRRCFGAALHLCPQQSRVRPRA